MIILGLDVSTTTIGWGVLKIDNNNISLINSGFIKPPKEGNLIERLAQTRSLINNILNQYQPEQIAIENIIQFMQGKSTAKTIISLTQINRMACLTCYDYLKRPPELFNVLSIRHGIKINQLPAKEEIPELVAQHLHIKFPYILKKNGSIAPESMDRADGIAVALYLAFILTGKAKAPKIIKKKKIKKKKVKKNETLRSLSRTKSTRKCHSRRGKKKI